MTAPVVSDPWEAVRVLYDALEAVRAKWKVDKTAPGHYYRIYRTEMRGVERALRQVPSRMTRVRVVDGRPIVLATDQETAEIRAAAHLLLEGAFEHTDRAYLVRAEDMRRLARAVRTLRLLEDEVGAA